MRILVFSEGRHEMGLWENGKELCSNDPLAPVPRLVQRLLDREDVSFVCTRFHDVRAEKGKGNRWGRKVKAAIRQASALGYDAAVVVIDRDGDKDTERQNPMRQAKNELATDGELAKCAVGTAVEAFDAWMIVDPEAIATAGGQKAKACNSPESLPQPKKTADDIFGTMEGTGLGPKYQIVAESVSIELLLKKCPLGFQPFALDVLAIAR